MLYVHDFGGWWMSGGVWMFGLWGGLIALTVWGITRLTKRNNLEKKHIPIEVSKEIYKGKYK